MVAKVRAEQDGSSPVTAVFGLTILLTTLLLVSQVLLHLVAGSIVTAAAGDAAQRLAADGRGCGPDGRDAVAYVEQRLGDRRVAVGCSQDDEVTQVTVTTRSPARGLGAVGSRGFLEIRRTATVPTESPQRPAAGGSSWGDRA